MAGPEENLDDEIANQESASANFAGVPRYTATETVSPLSKIIPRGNETVNINEFRSPRMEGTGALPNESYYPTLNQPIQTGTYSGSIVGSNPIYSAPAGLVPLAMMDARDAAVHKAALQKQIEEQDFMKRHQSPTTTHVAVQPELTNNYYNFLQNSIDDAKKKYGKNAYAYLNTNVEFNRVNKNFQDLSKFHDAIVDHAAKLDLADKDPNMVVTAETKKQSADLLNGIAYKGIDPFSEHAADIGKKFLGAKSMMDLDVGINQAVAKNLPAIENIPTEWKNIGTEKVREQVERTFFPPEKQAQIAHDFAMESGWDEKVVLAHLKAIQNEQIKRQVDKVNNLFPELKGEKHEIDFADIEKEPSSYKGEISIGTKGGKLSNGQILGGADVAKGEYEKDVEGKTKVYRQGDYTTTNGVTFPKKIEVVMPIGKNVHFHSGEEGGFSGKQIGNQKVILGRTTIATVADAPGTSYDGVPLDENQVKLFKEKGYKVKKEPIVHGTFDEVKSETVAGKVVKKTVSHDFTTPLSNVQNAIPYKDRKTGIKLTDEMFKRADEENSANPTQNTPTIQTGAKTEKKKIAGF